MRYFIKALKCEIVFLDHISIAISGQETDDERRMIDRLMTELRSLVEETQVTLVVVSHLRRVQGTPAEEGGQISLQHLRGSQTLSQIPDIVLAFERNQQAEDEDTKNTVLCRVLKNRPVGLTGVMTYLKYQPNESTMYEVAKEATVFDDDDHDTDF
jgi:twinkle protein